jgi:recombination protein RecR
MYYPSQSLEKLISELTRLPGIGRKTAQRLAFFILKQSDEDVERMAQAIVGVKKNTRYCSQCFNLTETDPCPICQDNKRDYTVLCVVEEAHDVLAVERLGQYNGKYHVLGGVLSPLDNSGPEDLNIQELVVRCKDGVKEVIVATNPSTEGEATAIYLSKLLKPLGPKITRIARGIPSGSDLEFVDEVTLLRSFEGRSDL